MPTIFISYRRADSASAAGRLYDRLVERYGRAAVFKDVDSIPPGATFPTYIAESIQASDVALVVIGPHWFDASAGFGRRRLDDPADFVRIEIETALRLGVPVIPVLVEGASLPPARRLPPSLRPLLEQNAVPLRPDPDFSRDVERISAAVDFWQAQPRRPAPVAAAPTPTPHARTSVATSALTTPAEPLLPAPRTATAVAEQVGIAARQKPARQRQGGWRFGRGAQAVAATVFTAALVATLIAALHGLIPGFSSNTASNNAAAHRTATAFAATTTALAVLGEQPFTSLGPCDKNASDQYNYQTNPYFWQYTENRAPCIDGSTVQLTILPDGVNDTSMTFYGLPYYGNSSFPSDFTATMTLKFNYTHGSSATLPQYDCAAVAWNIPNETDAQWVDALYVCQDGTWHLDTRNHNPNATLHPFDISQPFTVKITVNNSSIGVTLNSIQALPLTHFNGQFQSFECKLSSDAPHSMTVSHFAFTPGVA